MKKLNLGSGGDYKKGWVNVDYRGNVKTDIKWDLNKYPYPFKANSFDEILIKHVLEHLENIIGALQEIIRISKNGAKIRALVPHATSYANISDIQHKNNFTEYSFTEKQLEQHDLKKLKCVKTNFVFKNKYKKYLPFKKYLKIYFNGIYDDLYFEFKVRK